MKKNTLLFVIVIAVIIATALIIVFWKKIKPPVITAANVVADKTGVKPKKQFKPGVVVKSNTEGLNFRKGAGTSYESIHKFSNGETIGEVIQSTDVNGWVKVARYSAELTQQTGYVYSTYIDLVEDSLAYGGGGGFNSGAGGSW